MGRKHFAQLIRIQDDSKISWEDDPQFLYTLEMALLLSLREDGMLTPMQYHHAEEALKLQKIQRAKRKAGELP